ncbi:hypothetical protein NEMBOFW57_004936 [Staphylotrichum longicolle]|uniref:Tryptophan synthase beta chain-like PALP domain-containing protein n=1 Tax=Staphylotrichum longicolle TaxID=669026 RepID=A0AAD4EVV7_9PEZI|nr:hypothetical protein NEMBOFW57_004936 [Staphylotrichum longicolle]
MADPSTAPPLTRASVEAAHKLIAPFIHKTPVLTSSTLNRIASTPRDPAELEGTEWAGRTPAKPVLRFWFKCENYQKIGAFKARGAFHAIERLKQEPGWAEAGGREKGVVTHSSGNHAQALSLAALTSSLPCHIIMPSNSSPAKIAATRTYGAHISFSGPTAPEREALTASVISQTGARLVPPYDHPDIILGAGTAALELQSQLPSSTQLDAVITPCGGGGLLSGTALACSSSPFPPPSSTTPQKKKIHVFGAEPSHLHLTDDCARGLALGRRIPAVPASDTIADGLRTPVGEIPWSIIHDRKLVRGVYTASEAEIKRALRLVYERMKVVVEPSAVVGLAVALFNEEFRAMVEREGGEEGWDLGVVFSGGN